MERFKKKLLATLTVLAGMTVIMAIGFWTLQADAFVRPSYNVPSFRAAVGQGMNVSNSLNVLSVAASNPVVVSVATNLPKAVVPAPVVAVAPVEDHAGILNTSRQFALGMIETANDDREIGLLGEVSRFQIMPSVWRHYTQSHQYQNPEVSAEVARRHWLALYKSFKQQARREPTDFDMYVLWNTSRGYYASKNWEPRHVGTVVKDRAQRFSNLVERGA